MKNHQIVRYAVALMIGWTSLPGVNGAQTTFPVKYHQPVFRDGVPQNPSHQVKNAQFRLEVVSDDEGLKEEGRKGTRPTIWAHPEERYSIRLYNPLPVRVAVNLTVDGMNSISGLPSGISDGPKWMIRPYSSIEIRGWQVNGGEARRFYFTDVPKSYAQWRGETMNKDLTVNCGVIGAAFFWNSQELQAYYDAHPVYEYSRREPSQFPWLGALNQQCKKLDEFNRSSRAAMEGNSLDLEKREAATGMGEREWHPTETVDFHYNAGMFKVSQAIVVYYEFKKSNTPNPFPAMGYAPEMPELNQGM